jgi:hypothetical protein
MDAIRQALQGDFLDRETARIDQLIEKREVFLSLIDEKKTSLAVKAVDGSILEGVAKGIEGWFGAAMVALFAPRLAPRSRANILGVDRNPHCHPGGGGLFETSPSRIDLPSSSNDSR